MTEENALFAHLEELVDALPEMQKKGDALAKARAAAEVAKRAHYVQGQQNELDGILAAMDEHARAREEALAAGDAEREQKERALVLQYGNERGIRKGATESARRALEKVLVAGGFATEAEAKAAELADDALQALAREVEAFQADYAETLAACQAIEDEAAEGVEEA